MTDKLLIDRELLERIDESAEQAVRGEEILAILQAELAKLRASAVPDGYALVPVEPTPEMVSAAEEAHMPFGDMDIALRMAILSATSAPATVQDVNAQLLDDLEAAKRLPYQLLFNAMADAVRITCGGTSVAVSVKGFKESIDAAIAAARKGEGE